MNSSMNSTSMDFSFGCMKQCMQTCTLDSTESLSLWSMILMLIVVFGPLICVVVVIATVLFYRGKSEREESISLVENRAKCHTWCTPSLCQNPVHKTYNVFEKF